MTFSNAIAIELNRDRILSPQPREGRSQTWAQSSVRHILLNERYRGVVVWGKTKKVLSPETGKRIYRSRPTGEWRRVEIPVQRIVSEELWNRTHERLEFVQEIYGVREGKRRGRAAAHPISSPDYSNAPNVAAASRLFQDDAATVSIHVTDAPCTRSVETPSAKMRCSFVALSWNANFLKACRLESCTLP